MIEIKDKSKCCGCNGCENICPQKAITMNEDEFGFRYPHVDQSKCINCGLCEKACPIINSKNDNEKEIKAYACYNLNESERLKSSSGGIFILIAKEIIKKGGVVFGAAFDDSFGVVHDVAKTEDELKKFMGSKYVQSNTRNTYAEAKKYLEDGKIVLYAGTPCQIEGLKTYLQKDYTNLYTQDIICHGVPSPKAWKKYLEYREKKGNSKPKNISFRNKDNGWKSFNLSIQYGNELYINSHGKDSFMKSFLQNDVLRDSCYNCHFKKKYRVSDITLGDYWGVESIHPDMFDDKGTSLVIVNSSKGNSLFDDVKKSLKCIETDIDTAINYNTAMISSVDKPQNREKFLSGLDSYSYEELVKKYIPKPSFVRRIINKIKKIIRKIIRKIIK